MDTLLQDLRFALRALRRSPGFTAAAVLALALGIGASASIFSVLDAVVLRPLALPRPSELVKVWQVNENGKDSTWSPANYRDLLAESRAFQSLAAYYEVRWNIQSDKGVEKVPVGGVSDTFFRVLGVQPVLGRGFEPGEDLDGHDRVAVVTSSFFREKLRGDPDALGKPLMLSERAYTLVGVLPPGFAFADLPSAGIFVPIGFDENDLKNRRSHFMHVAGRLAPGVELSTANAELKVVADHIAARDPQHAGWSARGRGLQEDLAGDARAPLEILFAAVLLVLLIACANVAGLLLARGVTRRREIAIRAALGGGGARIVRLLLTEALLLALSGGALGLIFAAWAVNALVAIAPQNTPRLSEVALDWRVALFALAISVLSGAVAGGLPAVAASRVDLLEAFKDSEHGSEGSSRGRARRALVVAEVAFALVLAVGAGLLTRSFKRVLDLPLGFDPEGVFTAQVALPLTRWNTGKPYSDFFSKLVERVSALPDVSSAAATALLPLSRDRSFDNAFRIEGQPPDKPGFERHAFVDWITPGYFQTLRIPLREGRFLDGRDVAGAAPAIVVNEAFVRRFLPGENAVGRLVQIGLPVGNQEFSSVFRDGSADWRWTIVGVAGDVRQVSRDREPQPEIYLPLAQQASNVMVLVARTSGDPLALTAAVRRELTDMDAATPLTRVSTLEGLIERDVAARRAEALLLALFGAAALLLAALGIYALIAHSVAQRTHEIGIRMALGAVPLEVLSMVLLQGLKLAGLGVLAGLVVSLAATRALQAILYGVAPTDPLTYAAMAAMLVGVAALACLLPAWRATRVDPAVALRAE